MAAVPYDQDFIHFDAGTLGYLEGITVSSNSKPLSSYFGGLPYASPPVGPYSYRKPRPLPECYRYGTKANPGRFTGSAAVCPQPLFLGEPDESLWDEDCLQLNIHIPAGAPPSSSGWPVFFFIHGGFLQFGNPNTTATALAPLLSETAFKAIIVMPAYRVNALGFLASRELQAEAARYGETTGNMGFWDQRLALEWTSRHISHFGGDADNITVAGYSAGSHSAYQQLAHELYFVSDDEAIIKRVIMWSNSPGVQPKDIDAHQTQFDELLTALHIPLSLPADEKLKCLRATSPHDLVVVQDTMKATSEFRAFSDGAFISKSVNADIDSGDFGHRMKRRGIKLMNGECRDEHNLYRAWRTPSSSYEAVYTRLCADYPDQVVAKLMKYACGTKRSLPPGVTGWQDLFGRLYADMQVHCLERGFVNALAKGGLEYGTDIFRYRFDWRASCSTLPPEWGVTHHTDMSIWFWGDGGQLKDEEKDILKPWNEAFAAFVRGDHVPWGTADAKDMKRLNSEGITDVWVDDRWEEGIKMWALVNGHAGKGSGHDILTLDTFLCAASNVLSGHSTWPWSAYGIEDASQRLLYQKEHYAVGEYVSDKQRPN